MGKLSNETDVMENKQNVEKKTIVFNLHSKGLNRSKANKNMPARPRLMMTDVSIESTT